MKDTLNRIVVFHLGWLGDSVMSIPGMMALRKGFPRATIVRIINAQVEDFFQGCPFADQIIPFEREGGKIGSGAELLITLRKLKPDAFYNLHTPDFDRPFKHYLRDNFFAYLSGARVRAAYSRSLDGVFLTHPLPEKVFGGDRMDVEMIKVLGLHIDTVGVDDVSFWLNDEERKKGSLILTQYAGEHGFDLEGGYFCISPFGKRKSREWGYDKMAELSCLVREKTGLMPVLLGGKNDNVKMEEFLLHVNNPFLNLVGKTGIKETAAIMERASVTVTIDSGLMHLSSLVGCPIVAIFGPGDPVRWHPLPKVRTIIFNSNPDCGPCYHDRCDEKTCFDSIEPHAVLDATLNLLKE